MSKIMIVGGAGFIGSHLTRKLLSEGHEVLVYDQVAMWNHDAFLIKSLPAGSIDYTKKWEYEYRQNLIRGADTRTANESNLESLYHVTAGFEPDYFVYAGGISVPAEVNHLSLQQMLKGFLNCYFLFSKEGYDLDIENFLFLSSSLVYTHPSPARAYRVKEEENIGQPRNLYGIGKGFCEKILNNGNVPCSIARLCGVYGPGDGNKRVLDIFITKALYGLPIQAKDEIQNTFTHVDDVVEGLTTLLFRSSHGSTYNLTGEEAILLENAADIIINKLNSSSKIEIKPLTAGDVSKGPFNLEAIEIDTKWKPQISFLEGIERYISHVQLREGVKANEAYPFS